MADGLTWDDMPTVMHGSDVEIRRVDRGNLAMCLIRLDVGSDTRPIFQGLPDDECQCPHWGYIISGTMRVRGHDGDRTYAADESYYWPPGHNLEAVSDAEYLEISPSEDYDVLMDHCARVIGGG